MTSQSWPEHIQTRVAFYPLKYDFIYLYVTDMLRAFLFGKWAAIMQNFVIGATVLVNWRIF